MPNFYKLQYFDAKGRAEVIRLVLAAADQKYDDQRIAVADWPAKKPHTPWGTLPVLEVNGKPIGETVAIITFLAKEHGLHGSGHMEHSLIDSVVSATNDLCTNASKARKSAEETTKFKSGELFAKLDQLENFITLHGSHGHAVGSKLTAADVAIFSIIDVMQSYGLLEKVPSNYPKVREVMKKVEDDSKIHKYLKHRSNMP